MMYHHDPLDLAMAMRCKFPILTEPYTLPTLPASWPAPRAQTICRPLELAHPSPSLSRSGYGRNMLQLLSLTDSIFLLNENEGRCDFCSSPILAQGLYMVNGEYVLLQLHLGAGESPNVLQCSTCRAASYRQLGIDLTCN